MSPVHANVPRGMLERIVQHAYATRTAMVMASATLESVSVMRAVLVLHAMKNHASLRTVQAMDCVTKPRVCASVLETGMGRNVI